MRDVKQLHPELQKKIAQLQELCKKNGITIGISECLRTVAEQDALYAKGRTAPGSIVTNCKGSSYSSMHQWGVAFDFYLIMDVDGDGKTSDDAYNDKTRLFEKVGKIGQSIGLEWGGLWKTPDKPHFQLPDWGSTATKLKQLYGTPEKFFETWNKEQWVKNADGTWSYVSSSGKAVTGWAKLPWNGITSWYYFDGNGIMQASKWISDKGKDYYVCSDGAMATNAYVKSTTENIYYWVGDDGAWQPEWNTYYPNTNKYRVVV